MGTTDPRPGAAWEALGPRGPGVTLDRREVLRLGTAGALSLLWPGTSLAGAPTSNALVPVRVSEDLIRRRVVGLRPYRSAGFLVRAQRLGEKLLVHDYGHGGGGITLSWGTAHLAVEMAEANTEARTAAVLGCGVVGLSTAHLLQRRGWKVTIYARELPPDTTSNVAGGQWTPATVYERNEASPAFLEQFVRACRLSYRAYQDFIGEDYGVHWIDNYYLSNREPRERGLYEQVPDVFPDREVLERGDHPFDADYAHRVRTLMIEPPIYLAALLRDVREAGGQVVVRELESLEQVTALAEQVVMNCTGLGSAKLFGDEDLMPIKGQLTILEPQPEVDYIVLQSGLYMFPRADGILLGGTHVRGDSSTAFDSTAERRIVAGHRSLFERMRG